MSMNMIEFDPESDRLVFDNLPGIKTKGGIEEAERLLGYRVEQIPAREKLPDPLAE